MREIEVGRALACGLVLGVLLAAPGAAAQTEGQLERARTAFDEGVQLTAEERWVEAASRFREALAVRATPEVRFNLAVALFESGEQLAEAADLLGRIVDSDELDPATRREARRILDELAPQVARMTIRAPDDERGAVVVLDDQRVGLDRMGQPISVEPGAHVVELRRGSTVLARRDVWVPEGEAAEVDLTPPAAPGAGRMLFARDQLEDDDRSSGPIEEQWWFWTAIGGGVLVVTGVVIGVAVASSSAAPEPVRGTLSPGLIEVRP